MQSHRLPGSQGLNALRERCLEQKSVQKDAQVQRRRHRSTTAKVCAITYKVQRDGMGACVSEKEGTERHLYTLRQQLA